MPTKFRPDTGENMSDEDYQQFLARKAAYMKTQDPEIARLAESYRERAPGSGSMDAMQAQMAQNPNSLAGQAGQQTDILRAQPQMQPGSMPRMAEGGKVPRRWGVLNKGVTPEQVQEASRSGFGQPSPKLNLGLNQPEKPIEYFSDPATDARHQRAIDMIQDSPQLKQVMQQRAQEAALKNISDRQDLRGRTPEELEDNLRKAGLLDE